ncbi:MAG: lysine 2,3-aminomutase [Bacillota bacterium]|nr:lysine 2,3-aminomutase [Bacillota bacterium]
MRMTKARNNHETLPHNLMEKWTDWRWQVSHTIRTTETVEKILGITFSLQQRAKIDQTIARFPMAITPYYISLIGAGNFEKDPVFMQCFPDPRELNLVDCDLSDPLHEDQDSPAPCITHRYPDRVLFQVSNTCAMYCRHCTRKRRVGDIDSIPSRQAMTAGLSYIQNTPTIRDVLISGGDPLMLPDETIAWLLDALQAIEHVEVIRIGSRMPVVLPFRITDKLVDILSRHDNIWINTHFNHPKEITGASRKALKKLACAGIPLGNQSVLLRDVNDCPRIMKKLVHKLVANRVRPYYLYQCDLSEGLEHFRTNVGKGIEIMESLRGHTSGFAIPTYVIDAPGGGGKIPIMPNYLISWSTNKVILRNYEGVITTYKMPDQYEHTDCDLNCEQCNLHLETENADQICNTIGISRLLCDYEDEITLIPENLERNERNKDSDDNE